MGKGGQLTSLSPTKRDTTDKDASKSTSASGASQSSAASIAEPKDGQTIVIDRVDSQTLRSVAGFGAGSKIEQDLNSASSCDSDSGSSNSTAINTPPLTSTSSSSAPCFVSKPIPSAPSSNANTNMNTITLSSWSAVANLAVVCCGVAFGVGRMAGPYLLPTQASSTTAHTVAETRSDADALTPMDIEWETPNDVQSITAKSHVANSRRAFGQDIDAVHLMFEAGVKADGLTTEEALEQLFDQVADILVDNHVFTDNCDADTNDPHDDDEDHDEDQEDQNKHRSYVMASTCNEMDHMFTCVGLLADGAGHLILSVWPSSDEISIDFFMRANEHSLDTQSATAATALEDDQDDGDVDRDDAAYGQPSPPTKLSATNRVRRGANLLEKFILQNHADPTAAGSLLPQTRWAVKRRGAIEAPRGGFADIEDEYSELSTQGEEIFSIKSPFQEITILDLWDSYQLTNIHLAEKYNPEYLRANPGLFTPTRMLFLDGVMQSTYHGNAAYHEALVQPVMFAHPNPKRVAIIGGGECATLREVLRHNTIEEVVMIDIDPMIVDVSKEHLSDWNDCSMLEGSTKVCMDDPRATVLAMDAFAWFSDRFAHTDLALNKFQTDPFDIIIMDALDPQNVVEFAGALYGDGSFLGSLYNGLTEDGILISQVGESPEMLDPPEELTENANRRVFMQALTDLGFAKITEYQEAHSEFYAPWSYAAAMKSTSTLAAWYASEAEINLQMRKRLIPHVDGKSHTLEHFDGSTMMEYRFPHKGQALVYCRATPTPAGCPSYGHGYDFSLPNIPLDSLQVVADESTHEVRIDTVAGASELPQQVYIGLESGVHQAVISASSTGLLDDMRTTVASRTDKFQQVSTFLDAHAKKSSNRGPAETVFPAFAALSSVGASYGDAETTRQHASPWLSVYDPNGQRHATGIASQTPMKTSLLASSEQANAHQQEL